MLKDSYLGENGIWVWARDMDYFKQHYGDLHLPIEDAQAAGLRNAQLGAIHAIAAHFTISNDPAVVTMPTGSGKTAVLMAAAFLLRPRRVLVITPSAIVRGQIVEQFRDLGMLKAISALPVILPGPAVKEVLHRVKSQEEWSALSDHDVVVATTFVVSPGIQGIPAPPNDLFDLLLIDEAHHSPAHTWAQVLQAFGGASTILFTATPFRRDRKEIKGRFVYTYPLRRAHADRIFGKIRYVPVAPVKGEVPDVAIARAAEKALRADTAAGLFHRLFVRTDSLQRAEELAQLYRDNTALRLALVNSSHSYSRVKKAIKSLTAGELDGVICVNMLGEGFDFPALKIAAIHAPHRSLEVTLQFVGRFARTAGAKLGEAKFLAVPSDIELEAKRLYEEDAVWNDVILDLADSRVEEEKKLREAIATFTTPAVSDKTLDDLSLYGLRPHAHVKVYEVGQDVDLSTSVALPSEFETVYTQPSPDLSAVLFIAKRVTRPQWMRLDTLDQSDYHLVVVFYHKAARLLFVCSSYRAIAFYDAIIQSYCGKKYGLLPTYKLNRILRDLGPLHCFNVGMRNRAAASIVESYRIITGPQAENAISNTDGRLFHRGHVFGRGRTDGRDVLVGYSSSAKIWSTDRPTVPDLVEWCQALGDQIMNTAAFATGCNLDSLPIGCELTAWPSPVIAVTWDREAYEEPVLLTTGGAGNGGSISLLDCELRIEKSSDDRTQALLRLTGPGVDCKLTANLGDGVLFEAADDAAVAMTARIGDEESSVVEYLNNYPPTFYMPDFTSCCGRELFNTPLTTALFDRACIEVVDWVGARVDIQNECNQPTQGGLPNNIHAYVRDRLAAEGASVILYDHRTGEIADFLAVFDRGDSIEMQLYHCKASGGSLPGDRVDDVYDVCGQVVKSCIAIASRSDVVQRIEHRVHNGSAFTRGDVKQLRGLLNSNRKMLYSILVVQPGISASKTGASSLSVLAAASEFVRRSLTAGLRVLASA